MNDIRVGDTFEVTHRVEDGRYMQARKTVRKVAAIYISGTSVFTVKDTVGESWTLENGPNWLRAIR